jgi:UDP-2,3-diacylglucosamine hydrolase
VSGRAPTRGKLAFVGDVHLDRDDPDLDAFLAFLDRLGRTSARIVFLGDLFNVWLGRPELELPHQTAVVDRLRALRGAGVGIRYVEGNRDYRIGSLHAGDAVDDATDLGIEESWGGTRLFVTHGDLANARDRQYRTWRKVSRSRAVWGLFNLLPAATRLRLAESIEARMRETNLDYKHEFPEAAVREYAAPFLESGIDVVVLGHFHVEKTLTLSPPGPAGRVMVLPEWKGSRRHLEVDAGGTVAFVDS